LDGNGTSIILAVVQDAVQARAEDQEVVQVVVRINVQVAVRDKVVDQEVVQVVARINVQVAVQDKVVDLEVLVKAVVQECPGVPAVPAVPEDLDQPAEDVDPSGKSYSFLF
jgi:hypothetical protein